jgi:excinuclease ABC subunit C
MEQYSKDEEYEKAALMRDRLFAFTHINDVAAIKEDRPLEQIAAIPNRIEIYDISNLGSDFAVGSMVVFVGGEMDKSQYRKFRIKTVIGQDDPSMLSEVIYRRFHHPEWAKPDLIILDGGRGQLSSVSRTLFSLAKTERDQKANEKALNPILNPVGIPVIAVAKGPSRKGFQLFKNSYAQKIMLDKRFIEAMRDEAHRFAIKYHRKLKNQI